VKPSPKSEAAKVRAFKAEFTSEVNAVAALAMPKDNLPPDTTNPKDPFASDDVRIISDDLLRKPI